MKRRTRTITAALVVASAGAAGVLANAAGASGGSDSRPAPPPPSDVQRPEVTPPSGPPVAPGPDDVVVINVVRGGKIHKLRLHPERRVTVDAKGDRNEEVVLDAAEARRQLRSLGVVTD